MKIINRKSIEIKFLNRRSKQRFYINLDGKTIYFTVAASSYCGLYEKGFVHFLNEGIDWHFYVNDDSEGFPLVCISRKNRKNVGYKICHSGLVTMILSSTGFKDKKRFSVEQTEKEQDRSKVFKLSLKNVSTATN